MRRKEIRKILRYISLIFLPVLFACTPGDIIIKEGAVKSEGFAAKGVSVTGRVLYKEKPLEKARVLVYKNTDDLLNDDPVKESHTDGDGNYSLSLAPGRYFFVAKKGNEHYSYSGRNPITLQRDEDYWIGFLVERVTAPAISDYEDEFSSLIAGKVLFNDKPVSDAYVTIFLDDSDDFKGPGYGITSTDAEGEFSFEYLPESEYFVIARKRRSGERVGPIYSDDLFSYYPGNPVSTKNAKATYVTLNCVSKISDERAQKRILPVTGFSGRVLAADGGPVEGMHVFAYTDPVIGHKRPAALSFNTKKDGKYIVELKDGGTYYIGARQLHGDSPEPGELFGMYDETDDHGIKVKSGEFIKNIDIVVHEIMAR